MTAPEHIKLLESLHPLESKLLLCFATKTTVSALEILSAPGLDESRLDMASGWLQAKGLLDARDESVTSFVSLTETGRVYLEKGTPEMRVIDALRAGKKFTVKEIIQSWGMDPAEVSSAVGALKETGVIRVVQGGILELAAGADVSQYEFLAALIKSAAGSDQTNLAVFTPEQQSVIQANFHKRGKSKGIFRIFEKKNRSYALTASGRELLVLLQQRGGAFDEISVLTQEMLKQGTWKNKKFRAYNIALSPPRRSIGKKHPYKEFLDFVKYKFIGMGFTEMRGPLVENEFWDMDALFMPQFHPARNIHDVYFIKDPATSKQIEQPFAKQVAAAHKDGGKTGSTGWRYAFDLERAKRLILRSQGTAVSARTLASGPKIPGKYFSIARCFRYDSVDATHAPDFYQVEGIVLGEDINFKQLLGLLKLFGQEIAKAGEFQFRPAYFPFTEPSVELHVKHPELGWMELGGAGMFRPEVTMPLGVNVPVIAWGLGLDRMAMVALGIQDIRDLFSRNLDFIRTKKIPLNR
ncbi:MAG TPA: phenylalanine--tRNA ligase subunit alpha [Nitrospirota bacterium]|nr:phenylalanine--tRNA ligase subunit alpha [Nitrospirota bacterium]